jgi:hypothetical protein
VEEVPAQAVLGQTCMAMDRSTSACADR